MMRTLVFALALLTTFSLGSSEAAHEHGAAYEWAGIFNTPDDTYTWIAQKVAGSYADDTMKIVALPVPDASDRRLSSVENQGSDSLGLECEELKDGGVIQPSTGICYKLVFNQAGSQSTFSVDASATSAIAFFSEHVPTEFESTDHYFKDRNGEDIEPEAVRPEWEWAGVFETPNDSYMWTAQKVDGSYADKTMKISAIPVSEASDESLHSAEHEVNFTACEELQVGGVITPRANRCYNLMFDEESWQSLYRVDAHSVTAIAFFAQHYPIEFEATAHYLKDKIGDDIEPVAELPELHDVMAEVASTQEEGTPWGAGIGASLLVNLMTLVGVILAVPALSKMVKENTIAAQGILSGFAAGAILACAFFLLLFEATHLVAVGWTEEVDVLWRWGTAILAGIMLPAMVDMFSHLAAPPKSAVQDSEAGTVEKDATDWPTKMRLFAGVNIGDFFHNLCDGFFMGAAFKGCGSSFGWGVTLATVLHEIPQELADYVLLTGPALSLSPMKALACNFVAGLGVVVGTIIIFALEVGDDATGLLLAFGGGVYIHIGAVECMPRMYAHGLSSKAKTGCLFAFVLGAVLIGLILLDHEHCVPPPPPGQEAAAPSGGHAHGHR